MKTNNKRNVTIESVEKDIKQLVNENNIGDFLLVYNNNESNDITCYKTIFPTYEVFDGDDYSEDNEVTINNVYRLIAALFLSIKDNFNITYSIFIREILNAIEQLEIPKPH